jgi:hypothetical protein
LEGTSSYLPSVPLQLVLRKHEPSEFVYNAAAGFLDAGVFAFVAHCDNFVAHCGNFLNDIS